MPVTTVWRGDAAISPLPKRPLWTSMARCFLGRCPNCAKGQLFRVFLKPVLACSVCGEDLSHQRADDAPPYFTMILVGHIVVPLMVTFQLATNFSSLVYLALFLPLTAALTLLLLQPVKGAVIGLQWALYMHGFDGRMNPDTDDPAAYGLGDRHFNPSV